jgi:membrane protein implicated in regulation of membrane protease activity
VLTFEGPALAWAALAIGAAIVEVSIPHFGFLFVAFGAAAAALVGLLSFGVSAQILVFVVVTGGSLAALRQRMLKSLGGQGVPSRTEALVGREGLVTTLIDPTVGGGRVNVGGEDWAARAAQPIPAGTRIRVAGADGIVLEVTPA